MSKLKPIDKHIFIERTLKKIDLEVIYTSMIATNRFLFVFGGDDGGIFTPSEAVMRYDLLDDRWTSMAEMPHYLWGATAQLVNNEIFIMGGGRQSTYTSYNLSYNISYNAWLERKGMPISRKGLVSGVIDGIIYIAYGYQMWETYSVTSYCYAYNPNTSTWKQCESPVGYKSFAMSVVIDGFFYVLGGYGPNQRNGESITMERYCPENDLWEAMPDMPRPRRNAVAVAIDSKIFVLCGITDDKSVTMDYYDTRTREWTISDIPTPELISPGVSVVENKIYLTAGMTTNKEYNRNLYEIAYRGMKE